MYLILLELQKVEPAVFRFHGEHGVVVRVSALYWGRSRFESLQLTVDDP